MHSGVRRFRLASVHLDRSFDKARLVGSDTVENVAIAEHLPQLPLLRNARVFLSSGGMNSIMEALSFGVPSVLLPQRPEQTVTAQRMEELRLGKTLSVAAKADQLRAAVDAVAEDNNVRNAIAGMRSCLQRAGGPPRAAHEIARLLHKCGVRTSAPTSIAVAE